MQYAYRKYSTLPNLKKIDPEETFEKDRGESPRIQREKKSAMRNQTFFLEHENDPIFHEVCAEWLKKYYPERLSNSSYFGMAGEIDEDLMIHRIVGDRDWLCSAHVCFPSHWLPEEKIGRSFEEIHRPVPMNLKNSRKIVEAAARSGAFERFVWSVVHDDRYNFHPSLPHSEFDKDHPKVLVKVERQVTVAFPEHDFCLFILRQYLIREESLDKAVLAESIKNMLPEERAYKGLSECGDLLEYLGRH